MIDWQLEPFIIEACHLFECISDWSSRKVHRNANCLVHNLDRYAVSHQWDPIFQQSQIRNPRRACLPSFFTLIPSHTWHTCNGFHFPWTLSSKLYNQTSDESPSPWILSATGISITLKNMNMNIIITIIIIIIFIARACGYGE